MGRIFNHENVKSDYLEPFTRLCAIGRYITTIFRNKSRCPDYCGETFLTDFADAPIVKLAKEYDLIIFDHPHIGAITNANALLPLEKYLPQNFLNDQRNNQVGNSHNSYFFQSHQWGLAIDAAAPVASWREDEFLRLGLKIPTTWEELLVLAQLGYVALPGIPVDCLMSFYSLCIDQSEDLFTRSAALVNEETGIFALDRLKELIGNCNPKFLDFNPIQVYETLARDSEKEIYCPFAYGYTNYSRLGYCDNRLTFGNVIKGPSGNPIRTIIGGAGIGISTYCQEIDIALGYIRFVMDPDCQRTLYFDNGGQPGNRIAWLDSRTNQNCENFFLNTLKTLDGSYRRPRYNGYIDFQNKGSLKLHEYLKIRISGKDCMLELNKIYKESVLEKA
jgi:multiple sugar transport system substrate-binding protein